MQPALSTGYNLSLIHISDAGNAVERRARGRARVALVVKGDGKTVRLLLDLADQGKDVRRGVQLADGADGGFLYPVCNSGYCQHVFFIAIPPSLQEEATIENVRQRIACSGASTCLLYTSVSELRAAGIEVHMLTGDNEATAREIARKAGIAHYQASVLPVSYTHLDVYKRQPIFRPILKSG